VPHAIVATPPLRRDLPLSLVLGAGGVRGLAHIGVLEVLAERGFRVTEMAGTSVGALIIAFHAAVGADIAELRELGLGMTTRHLMAWSWLRRAPEALRSRFLHRAGAIPASLDRLAAASWSPLHHGVERIGLVAYDALRREQVVGHSEQREIRLVDAARGAAALPAVFPPLVCEAGGRQLRLVDGGVVNRLPVDVLFADPFAPRQVLAVDISNTAAARRAGYERVMRLRRAHPDVPIEFVTPDTIGRATIFYRGESVADLIDAGRYATEAALAREMA
jgi:NTE family protein